MNLRSEFSDLSISEHKECCSSVTFSGIALDLSVFKFEEFYFDGSFA